MIDNQPTFLSARLKAVLRKEFIQMRRDKLTLLIMLVLPVFQLILYGFAIHTDVKHQSAIAFDMSRSEESRDLLSSFSASGYFDFIKPAENIGEVNSAVISGHAKIGIVIPPDLAANLKHGRQTPIQVLVDASDSTSATSAISTALSIGTKKSQQIAIKNLGVDPSALMLYDIRVRAWFNPDFITAWYMLPGIMGIILSLTMIILTSMAIVRERERGTLEQLIVTPLKPWELLLGKIIPYVAVGYGQLTMAILVSVAVFDMPLRGSILLLYLLTFLFIVASLAFGLVISTFAQSQLQAILSASSFFMPSVLLSGFMFPREAMPALFYAVGYFLPMTYYVDILRGIVLRGAGMMELWQPAAALAIFSAVALVVSVKRFK